MIRRAQFSQFISSATSFSVNQYFRLMGLATCEIVFTIPISTYALYLNITSKPIYRWVSWSDTHLDFYRVATFPAVLWRSNPLAVTPLELNRWSIILCAVVFFAFFGFAEEAQKNYRKTYWAVAKRFGAVPPSNQPRFVVHNIQGSNNQLINLCSFSPQGWFTPSKPESTSQLPIFVQRKSNQPTKRDSWLSTTSHNTDHPTDKSETLYGSPTSEEAKISLFKPLQSLDSSRLSRVTI
jgi:pheromone a factor receptor